ncbi:MAG: hypothetical protein KIT14_19800 [bacterium]|nr:hypothetical protein [bacterium]
MRTIRWTTTMTMTVVLAVGALMLPAAVRAEEKADGTLTLEVKQVAVGVGWTWGSGVLHYKGAKHRFKVDGFSVNAVGVSSAEIDGFVYDLHKLSDFAGTYTAISASATAGGGVGITSLKNASGVRLTFRKTTQGLEAQAGPEGIKITLE